MGGTMIFNNMEFVHDPESLSPYSNRPVFGQSPNTRKMNYFKAILKSRCESNNGSQISIPNKAMNSIQNKTVAIPLS